MVCTELAPKRQHFTWHPKIAISTPLPWTLIIQAIKGYSHSFREQRTALYIIIIIIIIIIIMNNNNFRQKKSLEQQTLIDYTAVDT